MPALGFAPRKPEGREIYSFVGLSTSLDWLLLETTISYGPRYNL